MTPSEIQSRVLAQLSDQPKLKWHLKRPRNLPWQSGWWALRERALQSLRKQGKAKYLRKSEGGPGWVRVEERTRW